MERRAKSDMNTYNGPAVLISKDDVEVPVRVDLSQYREGLRTAWRGTITPAANDLAQMLNLTEGRLLLPNGAEGIFLRDNISDWVGTNRVTIDGQGEAPF
jgi:hypothetical protein